MKESKRDIEEYLTLERDVFAEDEEVERQLQLPNSMEFLNSDHFPLFVTVKRLILMLDASLQYSFFCRNFEGSIIGMENNVQWHNESKGIYMINQYYKQQRNYDEKIRRLG